MERTHISVYQAKVFRYVQHADEWLTTAEIARATAMAHRTARQHVYTLVRLRIVERIDVFPGPRYRLVAAPGEDTGASLHRLEQACACFGV
jgi:DNA-binding IclR family transcriptional regulator